MSEHGNDTFTLSSPTTDDVQRGEEVTLPCKLIACVVTSLPTPEQANQWKRAAVQVGGKKALEDSTRLSGAKFMAANNLVLARYNVVYLRTPNGKTLTLTGIGQNGQGPAVVREFPAKIEAEKDKLEILEGWPEIRDQVREAVEAQGESLDEIAEGLSGN